MATRSRSSAVSTSKRGPVINLYATGPYESFGNSTVPGTDSVNGTGSRTSRRTDAYSDRVASGPRGRHRRAVDRRGRRGTGSGACHRQPEGRDAGRLRQARVPGAEREGHRVDDEARD